MIGIVIVSHSKKLAEGVKELANQMSQNKVPIITAAGISEEKKGIGTDPILIKLAIEELAICKEILILMDMGSAVMNAQLAMDLIDAELKQKIRLCEAPLIEGAIVAAVQIMIGANIDSVIKEAKRSLLGKKVMLDPKNTQTNPLEKEEKIDLVLEIRVPNISGLHARPSVKLIAIISQYQVNVRVSVNNGEFVDAHSVSQVSTLGAKKGDLLIFRINGKEKLKLKEILLSFEKNNFNDNDLLPLKSIEKEIPKKQVSGKYSGYGVSKGIAIGTVKSLSNLHIKVEKSVIANPISQIQELNSAIQQVLESIKLLQQKTQAQYGQEDAEIFNFHILVLNDRNTLNKVKSLVHQNYYSASYAWFKVMTSLEEVYLKMDNKYIRERSSDILEIKNKVIDLLKNNKNEHFELKKPVILVVDDIGPAQLLSLKLEFVKGIISLNNTETSHAAILSKSLGIPLVTRVDKAILKQIKDKDIIAINGFNGDVYIHSESPNKVEELKKLKIEQEEIIKEQFLHSKKNAISKDGSKFKIYGNIGSTKEGDIAYKNGAEGIGLYRTEFLFMNREKAPSEEEQFKIYTDVCKSVNNLPVTIRTLDAGGDKFISYLGISKEKNPSLGLRGIRYCLKNKAIFKTQLKAICRVSAKYNLKMMYPMVSTVEEVELANNLLREVQNELDTEKIAFDKNMKIGIMVEVPSILFLIPELSGMIDFLSIGSNDLTQYLLASDREHQDLNVDFNTLHTSVLLAIKKIIKEADKVHLEVNFCGELAQNEKALKQLSELGIRNFSISGPSIPNCKEKIREIYLN